MEPRKGKGDVGVIIMADAKAAGTNNDAKRKGKAVQVARAPAYMSLVALLATTALSVPRTLAGPMSGAHVWWYGWVTCVSTGFGVLPFLFASRLDDIWLGVSNASAAGFMTTASFSLCYVGCNLAAAGASFMPPLSVALGVAIGVVFVLSTQSFLGKYEHLKFDGIDGLDARKALLIMGVMTIHSFTEGVAIGVSFAKESPPQLGLLISATLAIHNIPEGLAISIVLVPRGLSVLHTGLWCVFSSLPQPFMALVSYLFVEHFVRVLAVGLGFAAGAMFYVAAFEIFPEALEHMSLTRSVLTTLSAMALTAVMQGYLKHEL